MDLGRFERFIERQRRENGGESFGQHGFAGARRPDEQGVMSAGRGNLQGPFDGFLAFDFIEINLLFVVAVEDPGDIDDGRGYLQLAFEETHGLAQVLNGDYLEAGNDGRLGGVLGRDEDAALALFPGREGNRQDAFDGTHGAGQRQFADHDVVVQLVGLQLFAGGDHGHGDGQVETGSFLFNIRRGQVDGGASEGEGEPGIDQGGHDAVARFLDGGIGQADNHDDGVAEAGIDFDFDRVGLDPVNRGRTDFGQHTDSYSQATCKRQQRDLGFCDGRKGPSGWGI